MNLLLATGLLFAPAAANLQLAPAGATSTPPAGHYACMSGSGMLLGYLDVMGAKYRGIALAPEGPYHPMGIANDGTLTFSAGLGGFANAGARIGEARYMGTQGSSGHRPWVGIKYVSPRGNNERLDCERQ